MRVLESLHLSMIRRMNHLMLIDEEGVMSR
jgi:hypothetical protein